MPRPASTVPGPAWALWATLLAAALLLASAAPASAADSRAPHGARADWLPDAEWVMSSWLPFDEARLDQLLGTDRDELGHWLDDRRTLGELAKRRGQRSLRGFARLLVGRADVGPSRRLLALRRRRTMLVLTQAHLARHVLFHIFHTPAIARSSRALFGLRASRFRQLRASGASPLRIAAIGGRPAADLAATFDALLAGRAARSVALGASSSAQAARLLGLQRGELPLFLPHRYRTPEQQLRFICSVRSP